ncbi:MAG: zinc-ribbon domain-containing protein [Desulfohalobiaceae bacterium]
MYRDLYDSPKPEDPEARTCPHCGVNIPEKATFCRTCGTGVED